MIKDGKIINIIIPEDLHTAIKVHAAKEKMTIKELVTKALQDFVYDDEPLTDEEIKALEEAEEDVKAGKLISIEEVMKNHGL